MTTPDPTQLEEAARDEFLGTDGTGVLSFATGSTDPPHSVPVSYGYDAEETTFYFRLAVGPKHEKTPLLDRPVSFVTYGREEERWHSVVAEGRLERTTDEEIATETLAGLGRVRLPLHDVFGQPAREVPFEFVRLVPERLTARRESPTDR